MTTQSPQCCRMTHNWFQRVMKIGMLLLMASSLYGASFTVEMYGAKGDGVTDDSRAFMNCIAAMKANGQDNLLTLGFAKSYRLGSQIVSGVSKVPKVSGEAYFEGFTKKITILGNYATLKLNDNLKWGSFSPTTGEGYYPPNYPAVYFIDSNYKCILPDVLRFDNCSDVEISELYVNGNLDRVIAGGYYGDNGRQVQGYGIEFFNNNRTTMRNVWVYNCALDGIINTQTGPKAYSDSGVKYPDRAWGYYPVNYTNVHAHSNSRNGFTWEGGNGYAMDSCSGTSNGKTVYASSPMAGFDAESHYSDKGYHAPNYQGSFKNCVFSDNAGAGYVAWDTSDTSWIVFDNCEFQGKSYYGACVKRNQHSFFNSRFYGSQYCIADSGAADWHRNYFNNCTFTDESTTRYPESYKNTALIYGGGENMEFWQCKFKASKMLAFALPLGTVAKKMKMDYTTISFSGDGNAVGDLAGYIYHAKISNLAISTDPGYTRIGYIYPSDVVIGANVAVQPNSKVSWNFNYGAVTPGAYP